MENAFNAQDRLRSSKPQRSERWLRQRVQLRTALSRIFLVTAVLCSTTLAPGCQDADPDIPFTGNPVVAVHGFLASGDTWAPLFQRLALQGGYPAAYLRAYDYNSLGDDAVSLEGLDAYIDQVLAETGAQKVVLIGHSKGGGLSYQYLEDNSHVAKVSHYVHVGSFPSDSTVGPAGGEIPMLNLYSPDDLVVEGADIPGAENASIAGKDHYEIATSQESTEAIWDFVHDGAIPEAPLIATGGKASLAGKAMTFGENAPMQGASVDVWLRSEDGRERASGTPEATLLVDEEGFWGPLTLQDNRLYEFVLKPVNGRTIHYFTPEPEANNWFYLRGLPSPTSLAGLLLSGLPQESDQTVLGIFCARQAVLAGRNTLTVDGKTLSNDSLAAPDQTSIAFFLYDDGDGLSSCAPDPFFAGFPFVQAADVYLPADGDPIEVQLDGLRIPVPPLPSDDGIQLVVFP